MSNATQLTWTKCMIQTFIHQLPNPSVSMENTKLLYTGGLCIKRWIPVGQSPLVVNEKHIMKNDAGDVPKSVVTVWEHF